MATSTELFELGKAATLRGDRQQARSYLEQALDIDQLNDQILVWLAGVVDEPQRQHTYLSRALETNPGSSQALKGLAWLKERHPELFQPANSTIPLDALSFARMAQPTPPLSPALRPALDSFSPPSAPQQIAPPPAQHQVATPIYGAPSASIPAVYSDAPHSYYVPGAMPVGRGRRVGCVTAFLGLNAFSLLMGTAAGIWIVRMFTSPNSVVDEKDRREFQAINQLLTEQFISLQAIIALAMALSVLFIAATVGVARRSKWGWYTALGAIGIYLALMLWQIIASFRAGGINGVNAITSNLVSLIIYAFLINVLWRNREVFR